MRVIAYVDEDLSLGGGRYLMEPMVLARLLQLAQVGPEGLVLDIGSATGYSAAVLARLAAAVIGLDCDGRSAEHTSELQSLMRISYAVFCLKKKKQQREHTYDE